MKLRNRSLLAVPILCALLFAGPAFADSHGESSKEKPADAAGRGEPSAEDRAKMAEAHQRMAECLRSDRPMKECRGEMRKAHAAFGHGPAHGERSSHGKQCSQDGQCSHGKECSHGDRCPHDASCPHGDACDGSCKHHGAHGEGHGEGHGAMSKPKDAKGKAPSKDDDAAK